jgi:hypothetical protein
VKGSEPETLDPVEVALIGHLAECRQCYATLAVRAERGRACAVGQSLADAAAVARRAPRPQPPDPL